MIYCRECRSDECRRCNGCEERMHNNPYVYCESCGEVYCKDQPCSTDGTMDGDVLVECASCWQFRTRDHRLYSALAGGGL